MAMVVTCFLCLLDSLRRQEGCPSHSYACRGGEGLAACHCRHRRRGWQWTHVSSQGVDRGTWGWGGGEAMMNRWIVKFYVTVWVCE